MKNIKVKVILLIIFFVFTLTLLPYIKPKEISNLTKQQVEEKLNNLRPSKSKVTLIDNPHDAFDVRIAMIQTAKESIDLSAYIIHEGETTDQIFSELIKAADRGVFVRIIADAKMGGLNTDFGKAISRYKNIEVHLYNPFSLFKPTTWQAVHHEKHLSIDDQYALIGGRNYGDKYFKENQKDLKTVNDYDVFIDAKKDTNIVRQLRAYTTKFINHTDTDQLEVNDRDRYQKIITKLKTIQSEKISIDPFVKKGNKIDGIRLLTNKIGHKDTEARIGYGLNYLSTISTDEMILQTPYLNAHPQILKSFDQAVKKNVETTLLTNSIASTSNYPAFSNYYRNRKKFIDTGINIYEYQSDGMNSQHGKAYIFDDYLAIGSVNLDDRSFFINTESMVFIQSEGLKKDMKDSIAKKVAQSYRVSKTGVSGGYDEPLDVSIIKRILIYAASLFSRAFSFLV